MRRFVLSLFVLLAVATAALAQNPGKDIQSRCVGRWTLDTAASDFGKMPPPKSATLRVSKCSPDAVAYTYSEVAADGKKYQESWSGKPDGKMSPPKTIPPMAAKYSFHWEGDALLGEFDRGAEQIGTERNTFSEDGKTMTTKREDKTPKGNSSITEIWHRGTGKSSAQKLAKPEAAKH